MNESNLKVPKKKIAEFCKRNHIRRFALFGSVLRDDFGPDSDVDILVEFEDNHTPGLFKIFDLEEELSVIFGNRKIDLRTPGDLSRYFRAEVISNSEVCYGT
ncbi:DNA polymerase beta domain protein region [Methanolacinia petrolearia DSM 11571]|uniref:DNA polymerase beta domain protein region n=1 Tax=Methanolacinia petrolearia (strain DSM 11571 / OCM 486 / SEBR 4847) TaxID=679926 RepID=E1REP6_METP4|nr:nucleotidyltransferase [Methanolacinia petrolearia]ADN34993.1 DNA polymerase beta domain protein region [Methanolacinia petrolearia DSM 11571]